MTRTGERRQRTRRDVAPPTREAAKGTVAADLVDQQVHGSVALDAERERAVELDRRGEQRGRRQRFTHEVSDGLGIRVSLDRSTEGFVDTDEKTADAAVLEQEAAEAIGVHRPILADLRSRGSGAGFVAA